MTDSPEMTADLQAVVERLEALLEPFAKAAEAIDGAVLGGVAASSRWVSPGFTVGDLRRAQAAILALQSSNVPDTGRGG